MNNNPTNDREDGRVLADDADRCTGDGSDKLRSPSEDGPTPAEDLITSPVIDFDDMELKDDLLRGIYGYGFESPSLIQQCAIRPLAFSKKDLIAQAQSGTVPLPSHTFFLKHEPASSF